MIWRHPWAHHDRGRAAEYQKAEEELEALHVTPPVREVADKLEEVLKRVEQNDQRVVARLARLEQKG